MRAAPQAFQHQDATSSDINIEEKPHIFMTKCISISDEAVFRLLHVVCDRCLYFLSSLVSTVTDEAPRQSPKGLHGLGFCLTSRRREPPGMLCTVWMRASRMRETPQKKKKRTLEQCLKQHSTQDEHWRFLWNSCQAKKHPLLSTSKNNGSYQGEKMPSFHYNLWEQEAEHGRLAQPPRLI